MGAASDEGRSGADAGDPERLSGAEVEVVAGGNQLVEEVGEETLVGAWEWFAWGLQS